MTSLMLPDLPAEIIATICRQFCKHCMDDSARRVFNEFEQLRKARDTRTLINFSRTCRRFHEIVTPFIYHDFDSGCWNQKQSIYFLCNLCVMPELAGHVRRIKITSSMNWPGRHWEFLRYEALRRGIRIPDGWELQLEEKASDFYPSQQYGDEKISRDDENQFFIAGGRESGNGDGEEYDIDGQDEVYYDDEAESLLQHDIEKENIDGEGYDDYVCTPDFSHHFITSTLYQNTDQLDDSEHDSNDGYHHCRWDLTNKNKEILEGVVFGLFVSICENLQFIRLKTWARVQYASLLPPSLKTSSVKHFYLDGDHSRGTNWIKLIGTFSKLWHTFPELESLYLEGCHSIPSLVQFNKVKFLQLGHSFPSRQGYQNLFSSCPMLEKFVYRPHAYQNPLDMEAMTSALRRCKTTLRSVELLSYEHPQNLPVSLKDFHELKLVAVSGHVLYRQAPPIPDVKQRARVCSVSLVNFLPASMETFIIYEAIPENKEALTEFTLAITKGAFPLLRRVIVYNMYPRKEIAPYVTALRRAFGRRKIRHSELQQI